MEKGARAPNTVDASGVPWTKDTDAGGKERERESRSTLESFSREELKLKVKLRRYWSDKRNS